MSLNLFISMIFNIGFLVLIAHTTSRTTPIKNLIRNKRHGFPSQLCLAVFFGIISILSTYTGIGINGAIVNTRVIGVLAAGLIGGPVVGMGAALIGGLHRWLFDIGGFTSVACACSTILVEGVLGSAFHYKFQAGRMKNQHLILLTAIAEIGQMAVILLIARPFSDAVELVRIIALPMIVMNSIGIVTFISAFQHIFVEQNSLADRRIRQAMEIAGQCLPYLRKGLAYREDLDSAARIILAGSNCTGVAITDDTQVLSCTGLLKLSCVPEVFAEAMLQGKSQIAVKPEECPELEELLTDHILVTAPLIYQHQARAVGCLALLEPKRWFPQNEAQSFAENLAALFSTQLELSQIEYQKELLQRAEFHRLQSQVNPHFLFNCLNTISFFCREKPERARELLLLLSRYYRYTTEHGSDFISFRRELEQVETYLQLEKARFEDKLTVTQDIPDSLNLDFPVPCLILQPIVENAVQHGVDEQGCRHISVSVRQEEQQLCIDVVDRGPGFPESVLSALEKGSLPENKVGLNNVHQRLKSIYGTDNGLHIISSNNGSTVSIRLPSDAGKGLIP